MSRDEVRGADSDAFGEGEEIAGRRWNRPSHTYVNVSIRQEGGTFLG